MLEITVPAGEFYDEEKNEFVESHETVLRLEHSLVSISKWEAKWKVPFLDEKQKTVEQTLDYIRCMTVSQNVDPLVYKALTPELIEKVNDYVNDPHTATWFNDRKRGGGRKQIVTSELIYGWMTGYNIPWEAQKWHLNRLMTLLRICEIQNTPEKKMSKSEVMARNRALNAQRRAKANSKG